MRLEKARRAPKRHKSALCNKRTKIETHGPLRKQGPLLFWSRVHLLFLLSFSSQMFRPTFPKLAVFFW